MRHLRTLGVRVLVLVGLLAPLTVAAARAQPTTWSPQAAAYGEGSMLDQPVTASDGTVLRADVWYPTDPATGAEARGTFPVLLQQTPYGKGNIAGASSAALANNNVPYLVDRGYIVVIADVRGTGDSGGSWGLFDPVQDTDGSTLVKWAARLPHADGKVGLFGESYMGINQFLTEGALPDDSPVKAMFPIISGNDIYRDMVTQGGLLDGEFSIAYVGLLAGLDALNPLENPSSSTVGVEVQHAGSLGSFDAPIAASVETDGTDAYDGAYWTERSPINVLPKLVRDHIPAFLVGGWNDLFEHGELLNYTSLQNLSAGRPQNGPMSPTQKVDPRYQLMMGPWEHVTTGTGADLSRVELEWFDTWLRNEDTPLRHTTTPMHLFDVHAKQWVDTSTWPIPQATATREYFGAGTLAATPPTAATGSAPIAFVGATTPCDIQTDQWGAGALALATSYLGTTDPCDSNDSTLELGPGALTYTTAPLTQPKVLAGPIDATVYATATTTNTEMVATIEEVTPSGQPVPLTSGALLGSMRAIDPANSWEGADGAPLLPYHPYTVASQEPVVPGQMTRYDIEVFPTFTTVPAGWRLRLTLTTSDTPHLLPTLAQLPGLLGGVYEVADHRGAASFVNFPLAPLSTFVTPCGEICAAP